VFAVGVVEGVWRMGNVDAGIGTVPNVVVGALLFAAEQDDVTRASDTALARKIFDTGIWYSSKKSGTPLRR
jgi:hypothetical protein